MLRYLTAGESHGPALVVVVEGLPAGLTVSVDAIGDELARRRLGFGRGPRMRVGGGPVAQGRIQAVGTSTAGAPQRAGRRAVAAEGEPIIRFWWI